MNRQAAYIRTLSDEVALHAERANLLIGERHWGETGRLLEHIIRTVIRSHLPSTTSVTHGFVVQSQGDDVSPEQDILLLNNTPPLWCIDGLSVCYPESVIAAVSAKRTLTQEKLKQAISGLDRLYSLFARERVRPPFTAVTGLRGEVRIDQIHRAIQSIYEGDRSSLITRGPHMWEYVPSLIALNDGLVVEIRPAEEDGSRLIYQLVAFQTNHAIGLLLGYLQSVVQGPASSDRPPLSNLVGLLDVQVIGIEREHSKIYVPLVD